jgi:hypothetical protein
MRFAVQRACAQPRPQLRYLPRRGVFPSLQQGAKTTTLAQYPGWTTRVSFYIAHYKLKVGIVQFHPTHNAINASTVSKTLTLRIIQALLTPCRYRRM